MITKNEFLRGLAKLASRSPGTYDDNSPVSLVCSPTGMVPEVFYIFLSQKFGAAAAALRPEDFRDGALTMGELYDLLAQSPAET